MLRPGHAVAVCVLALLTIGVVMVNSAGMTIHAKTPLTFESILLSRSTIYAGIAMLALAVCAMLPVRRLAGACSAGAGRTDPSEPVIDEPVLSPAWVRAICREYVNLWPVWAAVVGMLVVLGTVYVPGIRSPKNGSHRWVNLHVPGFESVQPSELAKWGMVLLISWYAARSLSRMKSFWVGLVPGLIAIGLIAGFVVIEDLGTGALIAVAATVVLLAAGARMWQLFLLCPLPIAGAVLAIVKNQYRLHRIESFMNPYLDPQGKGFHMIQSMVSVANGQIFGRGLGGGLQKFGYLPEDTTDFIFAIICEELGVAGALVVLFLLGALVWSVWQIVRREESPMLKLIGLGIMTTVGVQAIINLAVVTGLGPTKGIALPLISSGGTGWILTAAALGLVIAIDRAQFADARARAIADGEDDQPEGYGVQTLGAMAMSAAAAAATIAEISPRRGPEQPSAAVAQAVVEEPVEIDEPAPLTELDTVQAAVAAPKAEPEGAELAAATPTEGATQEQQP
ncbi:MAG TPA: FtsW/RodA/SpoVE family cell cycle protein, partial [Phycisphaerales bacterium]|nr:FtsW/RodA/SpoVE family cell cycle protein [Phycisphaerales bacterium]